MITKPVSPTECPRFTRTLPRSPQSIGTARALIRVALTAWDLDALADDGALLASELVTNAVRHTQCRRVRVTITRTERHTVRIAVMDTSPDVPVPREASDTEAHGRGLLLIEALSRCWGTDRVASGKRVWAELALGSAG